MRLSVVISISPVAGTTKAAGVDAAVVVGFARAVAGLLAGVKAAGGARR